MPNFFVIIQKHIRGLKKVNVHFGVFICADIKDDSNW